MPYQSAPIGVFDSGMGGLTVLRALSDALPNESFIYLGDTARLPYGTKSPGTVKQYAVQMAQVLVERHVKALVVACNTATTAALAYLQAILPDILVEGVVNPGAQAAASATRNNRIAVIATETTIASNAYQEAVIAIKPGAKVNTRVCGLLVALAEEGLCDHEITETTFDYYLKEFESEDTLLLGCTHFPVFKKLLKKRLPEQVSIVDSALATAETVKAKLIKHQLANLDSSSSPSIQYLVTDSIERFQTLGEIFLGKRLDKQSIELI